MVSSFVRRRFARGAAVIALIAIAAASRCAYGIDIVTVPIGNADNSGDVQPFGTFGSVANEFRIGATEVTNAQYAAFLNSVARTSDPRSLFNLNMSSSPVGGIYRTVQLNGTLTYTAKPSAGAYVYAEMPVNFVSWYDAARFANWMHNGQPTDPTTPDSVTENGAYTLQGSGSIPPNPASIVRNASATWFLPSDNEWYKAAYYDPAAGAYHDFPTSSNSPPNNLAPSLAGSNSANFRADFPGTYTNGNPPDRPLTAAGAYAQSTSPYGTFDQGGNVWEWNDSNLFANRYTRGGSWNSSVSLLDSSYAGARIENAATWEAGDLGFRMAGLTGGSSGLAGDYNRDGSVNAADYNVWRNTLGQPVEVGSGADGTGPNGTPDGVVNRLDFDYWKLCYTQAHSSGAGQSSPVPEPAAIALTAVSCLLALVRQRSRKAPRNKISPRF